MGRRLRVDWGGFVVMERAFFAFAIEPACCRIRLASGTETEEADEFRQRKTGHVVGQWLRISWWFRVWMLGEEKRA